MATSAFPGFDPSLLKFLARIRHAIDEDPSAWKKARDDKAFKKQFALSGDSLKRPPRDYPADHPMIDDLKRKDFIGVAPIDPKYISGPKFIDQVEKTFAASRPLMQFLCGALRVSF